MSTSAPISPPLSADEFQALEHKVLQAIEIVKREREARAAAEAEVDRLQHQIAAHTAELQQQKADHAAQREAHAAEREAHAAELDQHASASQAQLSALQAEREQVRQRVEKMLQQMDELL